MLLRRLPLTLAALLAGSLLLPVAATAGLDRPALSSTLSDAAVRVATATATAARPELDDPAPAPGEGPTSSGPAGGLQPTVHYEEAMAHAKDRLSLPAGGIVDVPFEPLASDRWQVAGAAPRVLPAARATARQLRMQATGQTGLKAGGAPELVEAEAESTPPSSAPSPATSAPAAAAGAISQTVTASEEPAAPVSAAGLRREVFGFLPYWELSSSSTRIDYSVLSTIAYFGVGASRSGHLVKTDSSGNVTTGWAGWTSSKLSSIINTAHQNGTRVVLTVQRFSWTSSQITETTTLLSSASYRQTLANEIAAAVRQRGADGVNLDFEPIPSGQGANFVTFVRQVRAALNAQAPGYQLTFDTTGWMGNYDVTALTAAGAADAVFIMGYDYRTASAGHAGSIAPLTGPAYDITDTVKAYMARTSASKIILGVPYYGRAWSTTSSSLNSATRPQGSTYGYSTTVLYTTAIGVAADHGRRWDSVEQTPWVAYIRKNCSSCPETWRQLYYDDSKSLGAKYDLVNRLGLRGAGIWALGYDETRTELYSLLRTKFLTDATPPRAGIYVMPQTTNDEGIRVDWHAVDDASGISLYEAQVSVDGGAWSAWLTTTAGAGTYLGRDGHGYAFRARARDGRGNWSAWNVTSTWRATPTVTPGGFARVSASALNMRSRPSAGSTYVGKLYTGDLVAVTGGPVSAEGYDWYQVTAPITEWAAISSSPSIGVWVAGGDATDDWLAASQAPNATTVDAYVAGLAAGGVATVALTSGSAVAPASGGPRGFSPNGDGRYDALRLTYRLAVTMDSLTMRVYRASDRALLGSRALPGRSAGSHAFDWDGLLGSSRVADGTILIQLVGSHDGRTYSAPAANLADPTLPVARLGIVVDTKAPSLSNLTTTRGAISPNGDGVKDSTVIAASTAGGSTGWSIHVRRDGTIVRSFYGTGSTLKATWDGRDASGSRLPDGAYPVTLYTRDALGNTRSLVTTIRIDTVRPVVTLATVVPGLSSQATQGTFYPDGDGYLETADLRWIFSQEASGSLAIKAGTTTRRWVAVPMSTSGTFRWDGRDGSRRGVADGLYTLVATITDRAGNTRVATGSVRVERTAGYLRASPRTFSPATGDAYPATTTISFRLTGSAYTTLRVLKDGVVVRTAWYAARRGAGTHSWTWNGRSGSGAALAPGAYSVQLIASADGVKQILRLEVTLAG